MKTSIQFRHLKTNIESLHFTPQEKLNDFINEKLFELEQVNPMIITGQICLKQNHLKAVDTKICELTLEIPGNTLYTKKQCATFEEAIIQAIETIEQELTNHKNQAL